MSGRSQLTSAAGAQPLLSRPPSFPPRAVRGLPASPPAPRPVRAESGRGGGGREGRAVGWGGHRLQPGLGGAPGMGGGPAAPPGPSAGPRPSDRRRGAGPLPASESRPPPPARSQPTRHSSGAHVTWSSRQRKCSIPPPHLPPPPLSGPLRPPAPSPPSPPPRRAATYRASGPGLTPELDHRGAAPGLMGRFLDGALGKLGAGRRQGPVGGSLGLQPSGLRRVKSASPASGSWLPCLA